MLGLVAALLALASTASTEPQATSSQSGPPSSDAAKAALAEQRAYFLRVRTVHAAMMCLAFILWFPLGAFVMRLLHHRLTVRLHILVMWSAWFFLVVGLGLGIWIAVSNVTQAGVAKPLLNHPHAIIGLVVGCLMILQPAGGLVAHIRFKKTGRPQVLGFAHAWLGRALLVLGGINGALGLQLAENSPQGTIAYAVLMSVIVFSYLVVVFATNGYRPGGKSQLGQRHRSTSATPPGATDKDVEAPLGVQADGRAEGA